MTMPIENLIGADKVMDVRTIPCSIKHGLIIRTWQALPVGDHFILLNHHDPAPMAQQFASLWPGTYSWEYLVNRPGEVRIQITKLRPLPELAQPAPTDCGRH
jgi:uncharacterized protein (DUF2249 family)